MKTTTGEIGVKIRAARLSAKLTQTDLADKIGKKLRTVQKYESGEIRPSVNVLSEIACALNVSLGILLDSSNDPVEARHIPSPERSVKKKETKRERFVRVAEQRTQKVLDDLRVLSKCSRLDVYEYSEEDLQKIFSAIEEGLQEVKDTFAGLHRFSLIKKGD